MTKQIPKYMRAGELFSSGKSYSAVAKLLGIQPDTVKRYVFEYRKKTKLPLRQTGRPKTRHVCVFCGQLLLEEKSCGK